MVPLAGEGRVALVGVGVVPLAGEGRGGEGSFGWRGERFGWAGESGLVGVEVSALAGKGRVSCWSGGCTFGWGGEGSFS